VKSRQSRLQEIFIGFLDVVHGLAERLQIPLFQCAQTCLRLGVKDVERLARGPTGLGVQRRVCSI